MTVVFLFDSKSRLDYFLNRYHPGLNVTSISDDQRPGIFSVLNWGGVLFEELIRYRWQVNCHGFFVDSGRFHPDGHGQGSSAPYRPRPRPHSAEPRQPGFGAVGDKYLISL